MAWTDSSTVWKFLPDVVRRVSVFTDIPVRIGSDGIGLLPHKGLAETGLAVKRMASLTPITQTSVTLTGESWVNLNYSRLIPGEVVVVDISHTITYMLDSDYAMDYVNGKIRRIAGGAISDGASLEVSYLRYTVMTETVDYTANLSAGTIGIVSGGAMHPDTTVIVDYTLPSTGSLDDLIDSAITHAITKIAGRLKDEYTVDSDDDGLTVGATEVALGLVCRGMAVRALSDGLSGAEGRAKLWLEVAERYERSGTVTLQPYIKGFPLNSGEKRPNGSWVWV